MVAMKGSDRITILYSGTSRRGASDIPPITDCSETVEGNVESSVDPGHSTWFVIGFDANRGIRRSLYTLNTGNFTNNFLFLCAARTSDARASTVTRVSAP